MHQTDILRTRVADATKATETGACIDLRILATSDMHMHLIDFDYGAGRVSGRQSLASLAPVLEALRAEVDNVLTFDNGDLIQGTPMAEVAAASGGCHPMIAALETLNYDAAALGNHDFDFGFDPLLSSGALAALPLLCGNVSGDATAPFSASVMLERDVVDQEGRTHSLRIGVFGVLPPQTQDWARNVFSEGWRCTSALTTAIETSEDLRTAGADLVVGLCHTGLSNGSDPMSENVLGHIARDASVDVLIGGHTHLPFPRPGVAQTDAVDADAGRLYGRPAVQPQPFAKDIGVMDLRLTQEQGRWSVRDACVRRHPVPPAGPEDPRITALAAPLHARTLNRMKDVVGTAERDIHSFFARVGPSLCVDVVLAAQRHAAEALWPQAKPALLSVAAPMKAGGRNGPDHYTHIPAGPITRGHLYELYPFHNRLVLARLTGAQIEAMVSATARAFQPVGANQLDQPLLSSTFPSYEFDVFDGLQPTYDVSGPKPRAFLAGALDPEAEVFLTLNDHRAAELVEGSEILVHDGPSIAEVLERYLATHAVRGAGERHWSIVGPSGAQARFLSSPGAAAFLPDLDDPRVTATGDQQEGGAVFTVRF